MSWTGQFDERAARELPGMEVRRDEPMSRHTSFRIGGPARRMACPGSPEEAARLMEIGRETGARPLPIGCGTDLLVPDQGLDRLVVDLSAALTEVRAGDGPCTVLAQAGASLRKAALWACERGLTGLEFAHGIPGSVGGGVFMDAGAYGGEMAQVVRRAGIHVPGEGIRIFSREELDLRYRHSVLMERPELTVLWAEMELSPGDPGEIRARMRELMGRRKASQPLDLPSAGSAFKRPPGKFAGTLIDQCGLKGLRVGGAQVSEKHAGFLVNRGGATYADVTALIAEVQRRVQGQTGVLLEPEIQIVEG